MRLCRSCGILLHPTSLPGLYGIGDFGEEAFCFINFLVKSRQSLWQILPLNPTGFGYSPYQALSAFAGNPLLISLDQLYKEGLLLENELADTPEFCQDRIEFNKVIVLKTNKLRKAFLRSKEKEKSESEINFLNKNAYWLYDYALFMSLKEHFDGRPWNLWPEDIAKREDSALMRYKSLLQEEIQYHIFLQYQFHKQWQRIKEYANKNGIRIIGDMPIFISYDSSDTWVNPHLFYLDSYGYPTRVAGVPPDFFCCTGQLWGNPIYRWDEMAKDDYYWWRLRFTKLLNDVDVVRIDHFRGFEAYWEVPAGEETAIKGRWVKGPNKDFFSIITKYIGILPVIAEDLGYITPEVYELRDFFGFPGMKVMQFIDKEPYINRSIQENTVFYTGTHDNDTLIGWYKDVVMKELNDPVLINPEDLAWEFIDTAYQNNANWVIVPLQDVLAQDSNARMNTPGTTLGNWLWRYKKEDLQDEIRQKLAIIAKKHARYCTGDLYIQ